MLKVDLPKIDYPQIKLIGVGNMGCDAVNYMFSKGIYGAEYLVCSSDKEALDSSQVADKIYIENAITDDIYITEKTRKSYKNEILASFTNSTNALVVVADLSEFITSGLSSDFSQIKEEIKSDEVYDAKILCIGLITLNKNKDNDKEISILQQCFDTILLFPDDEPLYSNHPYFTSQENIFHYQIYKASCCIIENFTVKWYVCTNFKDLYEIMKNKGGLAYMGIGIADEDNHPLRAAEMAISSLLSQNLHNSKAKKAIILVTTSDYDILIDECYECLHYIENELIDDVFILYNLGSDKNLGKRTEITVIVCDIEENL
jgi:cell division protein FtsZ